MFGLGKSNEQVMQDEEARKAAEQAEADAAATAADPEAPAVDAGAEPAAPADVPADAPAADPASDAEVKVDEPVAAADAASAEVTKVDPATGEVHVETHELAGKDLPPFPADHKTSPNFVVGHKYVVTAAADFGDGLKRVVVGYTQHSDGGGLLQYVDAHPLYSQPLLREMAFDEQLELAKAAS